MPWGGCALRLNALVSWLLNTYLNTSGSNSHHKKRENLLNYFFSQSSKNSLKIQQWEKFGILNFSSRIGFSLPGNFLSFPCSFRPSHSKIPFNRMSHRPIKLFLKSLMIKHLYLIPLISLKLISNKRNFYDHKIWLSMFSAENSG